MKRLLACSIAAVALALAGCATAPPATNEPTSAPAVTSQPAPESPPTVQPSVDPLAALTIDVTQSQAFTFDDGLRITFVGATIAGPEHIGSDPVQGSDAVTLAFTYENGSAETIPLQPVPLKVVYGSDWYDADSPTLFNGDTAAWTELPAQIAPGSTVDVVNTYWIPAGEPITVTVDVSGSADQSRPVPMFTGITAP